jgi:hypothetical protein
MGDEINAQDPVTLQVKVPTPAEIRLLKDGNVIRKTHGEALVLITGETGVYRVEVYRRYLGKERGWIYSNPIFIR